MWQYEKKLQYPVNIKNPNPKYAKIIISQYGGPDGELGASMRYLTQRYGTPYNEVKGLLTDIGTEELAHLEMVATLIHQLTKKYKEDDVVLLLKDITGMVEPQSTEEREKLIQSGRHYCEMLPIEYVPTEKYMQVYYESLKNYSKYISNQP